MILGHAVCARTGAGRDAFRARNVHESVVAGLVSFLGRRANGLELLRGVEKAVIPPRDVVVHLYAEDIRIRRAADDLIDVVEAKAVTGDANVVAPVLADLSAGGAEQYEEKCRE